MFVTGAGTDVGKTYIVTALLRALTARGLAAGALKPIISGFDESDVETSDTAELLAARGLAITPETIAAISPWRFIAPLSPDMAAAREARSIDLDALVTFCRNALDGPEDALLIEGVGGVMAPLDDRHTVLDWIARLRLPTLLVVGSYLGSLSHSLTAAAALNGRGVEIAAVVISESISSPVPLNETADTLARFLPGLDVFSAPRDDTAAVADLADLIFQPA